MGLLQKAQVKKQKQESIEEIEDLEIKEKNQPEGLLKDYQ